MPRAGSGPSNGMADASSKLVSFLITRNARCPGTQARVTLFRLANAERASRHSATSPEVTFGPHKCLKCSLAVRKIRIRKFL